jgi:hypothetical protein
MSELVMFQNKVERDGSVSMSDLSNRFLSFSMDKHPKAGVTDYLDKRLGPGVEYMVYGRGSLATHSVYVESAKRDRAISLVIGVPMGVDATVQLFPKTFVTGSVSANFRSNLNGQLILQRQLIEGNPVGLSLGVMLIRNNVGYDYTIFGEDNYSINFTPSWYISTFSIGPRSVFLFKDARYNSAEPAFVYLNAAYLYDTTMKVWYPKIGFSLGFY